MKSRQRDPNDRFDEKWTPEPNTGCCLYHAAHSIGGYGCFGLSAGNMVYAHRYAYERWKGPIPDGKYVLHRCDTRACVNPEHLFLGTIADNNKDCREKGRNAKGDRHGARTRPESVRAGTKHHFAKLTDQDVLDIVAAVNSGMEQKDVAERYGICRSQVCAIVRGRKWGSVTGLPEQRTKRKTPSMTMEDAERIRAMRRDGVGARALAAQFGLSEGYIRHIVSGRVWKLNRPALTLRNPDAYSGEE